MTSQCENRWVRNFAYFLIILNLIGIVGFYFAVPVYQTMKHINPGWMTREISVMLCVLNIVGATLVIRRYFYLGLAVLFVTSTTYYVYGVQMRNDFAGGLVAYWDVASLLALNLVFRRRKSMGAPIGQPDSSEQ